MESNKERVIILSTAPVLLGFKYKPHFLLKMLCFIFGHKIDTADKYVDELSVNMTSVYCKRCYLGRFEITKSDMNLLKFKEAKTVRKIQSVDYNNKTFDFFV